MLPEHVVDKLKYFNSSKWKGRIKRKEKRGESSPDMQT